MRSTVKLPDLATLLFSGFLTPTALVGQVLYWQNPGADYQVEAQKNVWYFFLKLIWLLGISER
jgi:hypothetical protein